MKQLIYKGITLHKNSQAYALAQDQSPEGKKKLEKHMKEVLQRYKDLLI
jgi:hypothetical protein